MTLQYFKQCDNPQAVKNLFRDLLVQFHPDKHKDQFEHYNDITRGIIEQYQAVLKGFDGYTAMGSDGRDHIYKYYPELEESIMAQVDMLLHLDMVNVEILIVGLWVWVEGDTKPYKENLKTAGMHWNGKRMAWQWKPYAGRPHYSSQSNAAIKNWYGVDRVGSREKDQDQGSAQGLPG